MLYFIPRGFSLVRTVFKFEDFQLDCGRYELHRSGHTLKLEKKPMELLILLAESEGQLVTRTQIAERLWSSEVFVDTEHGINTAVRKIRQVLRDDPEHPRFVQTVTGKGYRFLSIVEVSRSQIDEVNQQGSLPINAAAHSPPTAIPAEASPTEVFRKEGHGTRPGALYFATGALAVIAAGGLATRSFHHASRSPGADPVIGSLAVLPLDNLSGDRNQEYLADGMTDELTTMLAKNSTLQVTSRTSVMQFKGAHRPLPEIARELGVDGVLEGSVARSANGGVHMTIQLIHAASDTHVWAESYDRRADELTGLPREAAQTIAQRLHRAVPPQAPLRFVRPEAHDAYLRGRYLWFKGNIHDSLPYFKEATELQPDYAPGWSGLCLYYGGDAITGMLQPQEALAASEAAGRRAVALDDSFPEGHVALAGAIFFNRWDWASAGREINRALELDPEFSEAYHLRAKMLAVLNRHQEALADEKKASDLDPFSKPWAMPMALVEARQYDAALNDVRRRLEGEPRNASLYWYLSLVITQNRPLVIT